MNILIFRFFVIFIHLCLQMKSEAPNGGRSGLDMKGHRGQNEGPNFSLMATPGPGDILTRERQGTSNTTPMERDVAFSLAHFGFIPGFYWIPHLHSLI